MAADFAAVVLAGGSARRLGGVDKVLLPVKGRTLLDRTLDAVVDADPVVVVGPPRTTSRPVEWTLEDPPGGGPLAGVHAGLLKVPASMLLVAVLAGDHPHLTSATISRLLQALRADPEASGAVLADDGGNPQWLVGVWRTAALRVSMPAEIRHGSLRSVFAPLAPLRVPAAGAEASDVDTPGDLRQARQAREGDG
ncbi:molybdenum cofactor guanylyltransferase [Saccharopolyspora pogona]|uniref:molybdenum cofactor guanylyltransferase n=1 Tax=Saccharopolyspora pogona TaxID=333966 RepID=UPI001688E076|nr:NTP transferase domain-containing protein [Saccharopolyspora pogona]